MGLIGRPETSATNHRYSLCNGSELRGSHREFWLNF